MAQQIEYYFSVQNLCKDMFLRARMDDGGWIPVEMIAGFNRVRALTPDLGTIVQSLRGSHVVETSQVRLLEVGLCRRHACHARLRCVSCTPSVRCLRIRRAQVVKLAECSLAWPPCRLCADDAEAGLISSITPLVLLSLCISVLQDGQKLRPRGSYQTWVLPPQQRDSSYVPRSSSGSDAGASGGPSQRPQHSNAGVLASPRAPRRPSRCAPLSGFSQHERQM